MRTTLLVTLAMLTVGLSGCFGFSANGGELDFKPGEDFDLTGNTVRLKAAVADLLNHEVFPGFKANLWAFCMIPADPEDLYSAEAVEYWSTVPSDGDISGVGDAFDGACSVPAPTLRVKQGDKVIVEFQNSHFHCHTIHWHGQYVPWLEDGVPGVTQHSVCPPPLTEEEEQPLGDNPFIYEFVASRAGTLWYHCHVDTQFHVMQGLYGVFIVEPQDDRYEPKDVDHEYVFVYSTLNRELVEVTPLTLADPHAQHRHGGCGMSGRQDCQNPPVDTSPDTWMLNGRSLPNTMMDREDSVMVVQEGDKVRLRILNAGETVETIHTHGHDMFVTHIDGNPIPPSARYYVDTLLIGPASRYDVTIDMNQPGIWVMHTHVDNHVTNSQMAPGGGFTFIAYESALEDTGGDLKQFAGAELPGGLPQILPLDIPLDVQYGDDRNIGNQLPGGLPSTSNVDEDWSYAWSLPCATRYTRVTASFDAGVPQEIATQDGVLDLDLQWLDPNGDLVELYRYNNGNLVLDGSAVATLAGNKVSHSWIIDGRYDALDTDNRETKGGMRQAMISFQPAGNYTIEATGTAPPGDLRFHVELDYHASEETLSAEKNLAALDLSKGDGDCDPDNRVFSA